jgi:alginate O-acetyltransferase complex protein AlgI
MTFNSLQFLVFFMVVTLWFFKLKNQKGRIWLLLIASCYFYMSFIPEYILILGGTIIVDYFAGIQIEKSEAGNRRLWLILSLIANIGALAVFKYYNFFIDNIHMGFLIFGKPLSLPMLRMALPIGLSFHTFQAMSYTIEVYRKNQPAERNFVVYALYVMFYPQLVAGPIERPQNVLPQLK